MSEPLVRVEQLRKYFEPSSRILGGRRAQIRAVDGVSFDILRGETLGLVGESGCGKTTVGRTILRLYEPTSGRIVFDGVDLGGLSGAELRAIRRRMQMIFQDPFSSLNPRQNVGNVVVEPLRVHGIGDESERRGRVRELLEVVGLPPGATNRYPHEFSGGQRQRIGVARALAVGPDLVVADEPVSALDVSIRAQIINLMEKLQDEFNLTYLFIAHDLAVVRHISDRIAVMYLGTVVELADADVLYEEPLHPYTKALLSAIPIPDPEVEARRQRIILTGDLPSPANPPAGCRFHTRCPFVQPERCDDEIPELRMLGDGHLAACHYAERIRAGEITGRESALPALTPMRSTTEPRSGRFRARR